MSLGLYEATRESMCAKNASMWPPGREELQNVLLTFEEEDDDDERGRS